MDEKPHSTTNSILNRLNPVQHLKPLSIYTRMISREQTASLQHKRKLSNPFINFKIEIVNNWAQKRKLDDSAPDDGYETPTKKAFNPEALSPDLGYFSPPVGQDSMSPFAVSKPALLDKTQAITGSSEIKESVSSQLHSEHVECESATEPEDNKGTVAHSLMQEKVELNLASAFDCDVDDILCLNPLGSAVGFSDNEESCESPSSNTVKVTSVLKPTVAPEPKMERGDGQMEEGREELEKEMYLNVNDVEEDKGFFSMSYLMDLKMGKNPSQSVCSQLPPATCSPLLRLGKVPENKPDAFPPQNVSLCPVVSGPLLESHNRPVEPLEGDVEEAWHIGSPIFESSTCQPTLGDDTTLDTSYETTLPLQVQVKSVVVALGQHTTSTKITAPVPEQSTKPSPDDNRGSKCVRSGRPVVFDREVDCEREKRLYVHSVTRHLKENQGASRDAMSELHNLMSHVADQTSGSDGKRWQHPSDLTRRNYQRRFGNQEPKMSLQEWQAKHFLAHKRFAKVQKRFERSPFP